MRRMRSDVASTTSCDGLLAGDHLDHRDQVRRVRPVHADDALGIGADGGDLRDRDARRVRGEHGVIRHVLLELRKYLVLELDLLRHGLEHEVRAFERRGQVGLEAERPTVLLRGLEPFEHALRHRHAALRALERLLRDVVERRLDARAGEHCTHAGAHRPRSDHCCASYLGHAPSFFRSWIPRHTRSGVSGSSVTGTPVSATAVATAAVTAASAPSPQPLAP